MVDSDLGKLSPGPFCVLWNPERQAMSGVFIHANLASQLIAAAQSGRPMLQAYSSLEEWLWTRAGQWLGQWGAGR